MIREAALDSQLVETIEDIAKVLRAGRMPRHHGPYRILIGNEALEFEQHTVSDLRSPVSRKTGINTKLKEETTQWLVFK
jgi:hypothetical protein